MIWHSYKPDKNKQIYKTRATKLDKREQVYKINESVAFRSTTDGEVYFMVSDRHSFGRSHEIGTGIVPLDTVLNKTENVIVKIGHGELIVNFKYNSLV